MRARIILMICLVLPLMLSAVGCDESTEPSRRLQGSWALVGYTDHGTAGETTGFARFRDTGTFEIRGTVTFAGEPVDSLVETGTYAVAASVVTLTTSNGSGSWRMTFSGNRLVLTLIGSPPPTTITLRREDWIPLPGKVM